MSQSSLYTLMRCWIKEREGTFVYSLFRGVYWLAVNFTRLPQISIRTIDKSLHYRRNALVLRKLIKGKRVLILGSGPSVQDLESVPADVFIMTCNLGGRILLDKKIEREIGFYLSPRGFPTDSKRVLSLLRVRIYAAKKCGLRYIRQNNFYNNPRAINLYDDSKDHFYLKSILKPYRYEEVIRGVGGESRPYTSSGLRLLQIALYFGAREIYLMGIDLGDSHYYFPTDKKEIELMKKMRLDFNAHTIIDANVMERISKDYDNVFSASPTSPVTKYVPYKKLA